jgi:hypothetical protein
LFSLSAIILESNGVASVSWIPTIIAIGMLLSIDERSISGGISYPYF